MCSIGIRSFFINVASNETKEACAHALYHGDIDYPAFPEESLKDLMAINW